MSSMIEEMYWRNFMLKNKDRKKREKIKELCALVEQNETKLNELLNEEQKEIFEKLMKCNSRLLSECECNCFISGFRTGSQLMTEVFRDEDYTELQE